MTEYHSTTTLERVAPPVDGLCVACKTRSHRYIKNNKYLCRYCWDRDAAPHLAHLTDEELDAHAASLKPSVEKTKVQLVNASSVMGFK